jgi:hypothetical protein
MNAKSLEEVRNNEVVRKRLAKAIARDCFRNTKLEDFHAGTFPSPKRVTVRTLRSSLPMERLRGMDWGA